MKKIGSKLDKLCEKSEKVGPRGVGGVRLFQFWVRSIPGSSSSQLPQLQAPPVSGSSSSRLLQFQGPPTQGSSNSRLLQLQPRLPQQDGGQFLGPFAECGLWTGHVWPHWVFIGGHISASSKRRNVWKTAGPLLKRAGWAQLFQTANEVLGCLKSPFLILKSKLLLID